jgi:hypothetical protein
LGVAIWLEIDEDGIGFDVFVPSRKKHKELASQRAGPKEFLGKFEGIHPGLAEYAPSDHVGETEDSARRVRAPYSTFSRFSRLLGHFDFVA